MPSKRTSTGSVVFFRIALGCALLAALGTPVDAQRAVGRVHGVVVDQATGASLAATLVLSPSNRTTRADSLGRFAFANVVVGDVAVTATIFGHRAERVSARVSVGADVEM